MSTRLHLLTWQGVRCCGKTGRSALLRTVGVSTDPRRCTIPVFSRDPHGRAAAAAPQLRRRSHHRASIPRVGPRAGERSSSSDEIVDRRARIAAIACRPTFLPRSWGSRADGNRSQLIASNCLKCTRTSCPPRRFRERGWVSRRIVTPRREGCGRPKATPVRARAPAAPRRIAPQADLREPGREAWIPPVAGPQRESRDPLQGGRIVRPQRRCWRVA